MTISTSQSLEIFLGNGVTTAFNFNFVGDNANYIVVTYTDASGTASVLAPSQYSILLTAPAVGSLWGIGGTVTYPTMGSPIASGTSLTIARILPLTQIDTISNQGNFAPEVIEAALDTLAMQIQQTSARSGLFRGTWAAGQTYNFGDYVVDGANGANTGNYYFCVITNMSTVWATELAAGDWVLAINVQGISNYAVAAAASATAAATSATAAATSATSASTSASAATTQASNASTSASSASTSASTATTQASNASTSATNAANSAVAAAASATEAAAHISALVLLSTQTASASASINFDNSIITSTYKQYIFEIINIWSTGNDNLVMTFSKDNGSNMLASGYAYYLGVLGNASEAYVTDGAATYILIGYGGSNVEAEAISGTINLYNPLSTASSKKTSFCIPMGTGSNVFQIINGGGSYLADTAAINYVRFSMLSGSITGGIIKCYGVL